MSIVGPTPLRVPKHITSEEGTILENLLVPEDFTIRQSVRPGMTGMAQLCDEMDFKRWNRLDFDLMYIKKRSPVLYLKLILKSCWVVFKRPR